MKKRWFEIKAGDTIADDNNARIIQVVKINTSSKTAECIESDYITGDERTALFTLAELTQYIFRV